MSKRENNKKWIIIIGSAILICFLLYLFIPTYSTLRRYREDRDALNNRIKELTNENENLKTEIIKLKSDSVYIEKIARKELGMTRQGETIYRIEEKEDTNVSELNR
jgi:cell division protein FtsL